MKLLIICLLFISFQCISQDSLVLLKKLSIKGQQFQLDILGNIYVINNNTLYKYNKSGIQEHSYSNKIMSSITSVDVKDPLKIMLYFNDFNKIIFLDNTLSLQSDVIDINKLLSPKPILTCASYNNGFWLYEPTNNELLRFSSDLQLTQKSNSIRTAISTQLYPVFVTEQNEKVYLCDSSQGIFIFDKFGGLIKTISAKKLITMQSQNDYLVWLNTSGELHVYNPVSFHEKVIQLPLKNTFAFSIMHDVLYLFNGETLAIYAFQTK